MYRIFLVEDDETIAKLVRRHLEKWDYDVHVVQKFDAVMSEFASFDPHLVLMDIGLPFYNGYHWCTEIRRVSKVPVVFLSSAADNMNIVMAVSMGADDFIAKPFDLDVLTVKIQAIIRRCYDFGANNSVLEHNGAMLNISDATITYDDKRLELTKNELKILQTLFDNKERIVSRSLLMEKLWESDAYVDENTLSVNVNRLRKKLDSIGLESFIVTKKGLGYRLGCEVMAKIQNKPHLTNFIKQNYIWILMIVTMTCIHLLYMYLIGARKQDLVYAAVLDAILLLITVLVGFFRYSSKVKALSDALKRPVEEQAQLPEATDDVEILYHRLLENQSIARSESESSAAIRQSQMRDYYSMWVHQIKTPISAMKLLLEAEREELGQFICDDEQSQCHIGDMTGGNIGAAGLNAALKQQAVLTELSDNMDSLEDELFRIEEYVSMALQYQRVSSTENDFVLEKVSVDGVIRDTIKKYAKIMIRRHIGINYSGTGQEVYTDGKWLAFMLEQILSNAIKYTPHGVVTIETAEEKDRFFITIKDTGIGIKAEDLPRVFEKGYTGYNGHADKKATGIGLYLCRQMADKLGHTIRMESEIGKGTKVWIGFDLDYTDVRD